MHEYEKNIRLSNQDGNMACLVHLLGDVQQQQCMLREDRNGRMVRVRCWCRRVGLSRMCHAFGGPVDLTH